jgi:hypothetical protein
MARYHLDCGENVARRIEGLATRYGLTEEEVLEQLVEIGLEEIDHRAVR